MGVEVPEEHGGAGMSFTAACLVVEEVAKASGTTLGRSYHSQAVQYGDSQSCYTPR
jgi:alkylation response protein AidB-like acyl-CoA dehydrogenase